MCLDKPHDHLSSLILTLLNRGRKWNLNMFSDSFIPIESKWQGWKSCRKSAAGSSLTEGFGPKRQLQPCGTGIGIVSQISITLWSHLGRHRVQPTPWTVSRNPGDYGALLPATWPETQPGPVSRQFERPILLWWTFQTLNNSLWHR